MSYFVYTKEDYKNLFLAFSMFLENDKTPLPELMIGRGILKTVKDAINTDWDGILKDSEMKGLIEDNVHWYIIQFLDHYICLLVKLIYSQKCDKYWHDEFTSYYVAFNSVRRDLIIKKPQND